MSLWATKVQNFDVGLSTNPYMCVTKSRDISFRISFVSVSVVMAFIIDGRQRDGMEKLEGN